MNINVTLIFQAINFYITYLFLQNILFAPIDNLIQQKELAKKGLIFHLKEKATGVSKLQIEKGQALLDFKKYIKENYKFPSLAQMSSIPELDTTIDANTIEKLSDESSKFLIKRVTDAF
jgi:predicted transcriptional regulator